MFWQVRESLTGLSTEILHLPDPHASKPCINQVSHNLKHSHQL